MEFMLHLLHPDPAALLCWIDEVWENLQIWI